MAETPNGNGEPQKGVVTAHLEGIRWQKDRYIIGVAREPGRSKTFSVLGNLLEPKVGQLYEFTGKWSKNAKFNSWDLRFTTYRTIIATDSNGIYHYLVRTAKHVGPVIAEQLIKLYGPDTLKILKEDPMRPVNDGVNGLTPERCRELSETLVNNEKLEAAMVEVHQMIGGLLGPSTTEKAIAAWGANAGKVIKRNPHRLADLYGVGFMQADSVYFKLGGGADALRRHARAVLHVIGEMCASEGHTRVTKLALLAEVSKLIGSVHPKALTACLRAKAIVECPPYLAPAKLAKAERDIADKLRLILAAEHRALVMNDELRLLTETLEDDQLNAFLRAQTAGAMVLCGAPGTGKTYTLARILALWKANNLSVALAAPTGKAAKQMELALSATVGLPAFTIHSLLEPDIVDDEFIFTRNEHNPLTCSALVVDEASMIDVPLMASLLRAVSNGCRLLIVGDHYQLPSVGPGAVLRDLINAGVPHVELKKIKRNAGRIVHACHDIKDGRQPSPAKKLDLAAGDNWRHLESHEIPHTKELIEKLLREKIPEMGIDNVWQTQQISPTNETGHLSCATLNYHHKGIVNPGQNAPKLPFAVNDKIVRTKNGRVQAVKCDELDQPEEVRIVNGDIGCVREIADSHIIVDFLYPDRRVKIPRSQHHLKLAYCMTCHKMQGSEVDVVILPLHKSTVGLPFVTREWIYTAISRAKKFIITIGSLDLLPAVIARVGNLKRVTGLAEMLK